jgi:GAF domain-containing protein
MPARRKAARSPSRTPARPRRPATPLRRQLAEALERERALADILRVINASPSAPEPVFEAILDHALRLCASPVGMLFLYDGEVFRIVAERGAAPAFVEPRRRGFRIGPHTGLGRAVAERRPVQIPDVLADRAYAEADPARLQTVELLRARTVVWVPLLREGVPVGAISVWRQEVRAFTSSQIDLLAAFASQAVIALENARLFQALGARNRDLTQALERETATGAILRAIASSPTELQPVLDAIAQSAARVCGASDAVIYRVEQADVTRIVAVHGAIPKRRVGEQGRNLVRDSIPGRAMLERHTIHVRDIQSEEGAEFPFSFNLQRELGVQTRTMLATPLLREGVSIGAILIRRAEVQPFTDRQIEMLETFAAQAVIAIENARLFQELQARNRELTESLEQQTATAEILGVISSSPTEIEPVLQAVAENAARLCNALDAQIFRVEGGMHRRVAKYGPIPSGEPLADALPTERDSVAGCAILDRRTVQVEDLLAVPDGDLRRSRFYQERVGYRSVLATPLLREGIALGAIAIRRMEAGPFAEPQVRLLETFAAQAVIAIENVRLFQELQARNQELTGALARQTATSEILQVISQSPTSAQPVFEAIVKSASRLLGGAWTALTTLEGDALHVGAYRLEGTPDDVVRDWLQRWPRSLADEGPAATAVRTGQMLSMADAQTDPRGTAAERATAVAGGYRCFAIMPMMKEGRGVGAIHVARQTVGPFTDVELALLQTFADQAVIAIENVRLFHELQARNRELTESLEQQTATAEILQTMSASPTDVQPVFDTIIQRAVRLCGAAFGILYRTDGQQVGMAAQWNLSDEGLAAFRRLFPRAVDRTFPSGEAILDRTMVHIPDVEVAYGPMFRETARTQGFRSQIAVPLLREGVPIGTLGVSRREVGPFSEKQIALLRTFADQAVIAIENVRLFQELQARNRGLTEALEQQTATAEILQVISGSPTDVQPVFDVIARNAGRLCDALFTAVFRLDGDLIHLVAHHNVSPSGLASFRSVYPRPPGLDTLAGRAILERAIVQVRDAQRDPDVPGPARTMAGAIGYRAGILVPLLREGEPLGVIAVSRSNDTLFSPSEVALLQTFAAQAVIAIENVRLFQELQARNRELTEALEQQTATAEILRVISASPTDVQPVFDAIIRSAVRICGAALGGVARLEGDRIHIGSLHSVGPADLEVIRRRFPVPLDTGSVIGRAMLERRTLNHGDLDLVRTPTTGEFYKIVGWRSQLTVPMLAADGRPIGAIAVCRRETGLFSERHVAMLETFADQAVIALGNVRLFQELQSRNRELTESLAQQTATSEVLKVISRSTFDLEPVLETLIENATRLCDAQRGVMYRRDGELFRPTAAYNAPAELRAFLEESPHRPGRGSAVGRVALDHQVVHIPDVTADPEYSHPSGQIAGLRAVLAVPMFREGALIGAMGIWSDEVRVFTPKQVELVTTFADQAVIAIENVRLLQELRARTDELARSVQELRALGEVGQAVSSTLDLDTVLSTVVARAVELSATDGGAIYELDETAQEFQLRATHGMSPELIEAVRSARIRVGVTPVGRTKVTRQPVQVPDILDEPPYPLREVVLQAGFRAFLAVPLVREDEVVGALVVRRRTPGEFPEGTVNLLQTFAAQSVLAIQNARLFRELEEKSRQLEVASRHKSQFLANMSHELRTPLNAILGYTELILDSIYGEIPGRAREVMERIDKSGRHLLGLINDVLDLSKIEAGQLTLALTEYSLRDVVQTVATAVEALAAEKQLALKVAVAPDLPRGRGDERRLAQVLLNLVGNAIKFTEAGEVRVEATAAADRFLVAVTDTGPGIAEADQQRIFEEFQQADTSSTRKKGGTGLGLSIARRIVEMHGGRLWVESAPGRGSIFRFTVPVRA